MAERTLTGQALGRIGPDAKTALPRLAENLKDERESVRHGAALAIGLISPQNAQVAVATLADALSDRRYRQEVAGVLGRIGADAKAAVPALIDALKDGWGSQSRTRVTNQGSISRNCPKIAKNSLRLSV